MFKEKIMNRFQAGGMAIITMILAIMYILIIIIYAITVAKTMS